MDIKWDFVSILEHFNYFALILEIKYVKIVHT